MSHGAKHIGISCLANECTCMYGSQATQYTKPVCQQNNMEYCTRCEPGFTIHADHNCRKTECHCENGIGKSGTKCQSHGMEDCHSCDPGFHLTTRGASVMLKGTARCEHDGNLEMGRFNCLR